MGALAPRALGGLLWLSTVAPCAAWAQTPTENVAPAQRRLIELSIVGELSPAGRAALTKLLEAELLPASLELRVMAEGESERSWLTSRENSASLMRVRLDVRDSQQWHVQIGDVARGRWLSRKLPGSASNAAAIEGAASVVTAAGLALREGFELTAADSGSKPQATPPQPAAPAAEDAGSVPMPPASALPAVRVLSNLAFEAASFERAAPVQAGLSVALGVRFRELLALRLAAAQYWPAHFESSLGEFRIDRRAASLSLGMVALTRPLELELELGGGVELLRRAAAHPIAGVAARNESQQARFGLVGGARVRHRIFSMVALELRLGGGFYPAPIRYVAGAPETWVLSQPWPWVVQAALGVELRAP